MAKKKQPQSSQSPQSIDSPQSSDSPQSVEDLEAELDGDSLEEAIAKLTPEQAEMFMKALTLTMKKRQSMLVGTLLALFLLVGGSLAAFILFINREPGSFMIWVFLLPFGGAGLSMWFFGRRAQRAGVQTQDTLAAPAVTP